MMNPKRIAIFASGSGSNAQQITEYFAGNSSVEISAIYCNNKNAFVLERAKLLNVPTILFDRDTFYNSDTVLDDLKTRAIDWIVLAGFLWLIPGNILKAFPNKIINIHPALLPAFGGKGMYGMKVHESVIVSGDTESGITIHFVNENYDEGDIVFQARCKVNHGDTPEMLAAKIHRLEYVYFPAILEKLFSEEITSG